MKFDYGKEGLEIALKETWNYTILKPKEQKTVSHPVESIRRAIRNPIGTDPLHEIIERKEKLDQICIVVSDATRPVPSHLLLKALVKELNLYGIPDEKIQVLIATGLHRPSREEELVRIMGAELKGRLRSSDHRATDRDSLVYLGEMEDHSPIYINKTFYESDLKILTGYVEPHFFAGFSGGRKAIVPGIAGEETIQRNHSAANIASPFARFGVYKENPLHQHALQIARKMEIDFMVNVCIDENHGITQIAAGDFEKAHEKLVEFQMKKVFHEIEKPYDIVVCGNGGYPLDLNLYQAVKSIAIGEMGVKKGGTIISVNECTDGIGIGQDKFRELLFFEESPKILYNKVLNEEIIVPDQWEIQVLTRVLMKADVYIISQLKEQELGNLGLKYAESVEEAIKHALRRHGSDAQILILPHGPQILPILKK